MEEAHKAILWFVVMILVLMLVLSLIGGYNFTVVAPQIVLAQNYKKLVIPDSEMLKYMLQLPVVINSSALTAYFPEYILISNGSEQSIEDAILHILSMNASLIAPGPYWEAANLAGLLTANTTSHKSFLIAITNGTDMNNVTYYNMTLPFFNATPFNISYPPSVNVSAGSPTYRIINKYSVTTNVQVYYTQSEELVGCVTRQEGNTTYVYEYYGYSVSGTAYLFANNNLINTQSFSFFVWYWGGTFKYTIYGFTTVPPGVSELVFGNYSLTYWEGSNQTVHAGNKTYIITKYYPVGPAIQTYGYTFNWYEYNVTIPVHIMVYNGTNPRTQVGNNVYNSRDIMTNFSYTIWSSAPQQSGSTHIVTYDYIQVGNHTIQRTWDAGAVGVTSKAYVEQSGNEINYYLTFSTSSNVAKLPPWVFEHVPQAEVYTRNYAYDFLNGPAYYYALAKILLENFSDLQLFEIAHGLQSYVTLSNSSWPLATALRYGNGSMTDIYYQIMPLLFNIQYHNFTSENASILIGAFNVNISNRTIIVENGTATLTGLPLGTLLTNGYVNISTVLQNATFTFYEWPNYGSPPILFEAYPTGNYSVEFLL